MASTIAIAAGVIRQDPSLTAGASAASLLSMAITALPVVRGWITDTAVERQRLNEEATHLASLRAQCVAAQVALVLDRERLRRDAASATARMEALLEAERQQLQDEADGDRNQLILETTDTILDLVHRGLLQPRTAGPRSRVLHFPTPHTREPARGHGVRGS